MLVTEALISRGWIVDVLRTEGVSQGKPASQGVNVIPVALPRLHWRLGFLEPVVRGLALLRKVMQLERLHRYEAIECVHMDGIGWALALVYGRRFFLRMHTSGRQHSGFSDVALAPSERAGVRWDRITARRASHLVVGTQAHALEMAAENDLPVDRFEVLYHATPTPPHRNEAGSGDRILYLGAMEQRKGIDTFILASAIAQSRGVPGRWTAVGRHSELWMAFAREHDSDAILVGPVDEATLERTWQETRCVVVPSRYESFGLVVIEAMSRGIPVVASRGGALPEVVGDAGILVDVDQPGQIVAAVDRIVNEPGLEVQLQRASYDRYQREFVLGRFAERLERLLCGPRSVAS